MKAFKYLIFLLPFFLVSNAYSSNFFVKHNASDVISSGTSLDAACKNLANLIYTTQKPFYWDGSTCRNQSSSPVGFQHLVTCPSATSKDLKVPANSTSYVCVAGCQYRLRACVDVDIEPGMTCSAISTGQNCGTNPPPKTPDPNDPTPDPATPDLATPDPADPNGPPTQNTANSESNSTSTSTSTSTTNNNTTTTNTTTNTTTITNTTINLDRLEQIMKNMTSILSSKLDAILGKMGGDGSGNGNGDGGVGGEIDLSETNQKIDDTKGVLDEIKDWLTGGEEGAGDAPFGDGVAPSKTLDAQSFKTNIFGSNAQCPADVTLSLPAFARGFSKTFSFADWCYYLSLFGNFILIAAYCMGAYIIVSKS